MTIAQCKSARRKFQRYYGKPIIGQPKYRRKSTEKMDRLLRQRIETERKIAQGKNKKAAK